MAEIEDPELTELAAEFTAEFEAAYAACVEACMEHLRAMILTGRPPGGEPARTSGAPHAEEVPRRYRWLVAKSDN